MKTFPVVDPVMMERWRLALGESGEAPFTPDTERVREADFPEFHGTFYRQRTGGETWQQVLLMTPHGIRDKRPAVVTPFYSPDGMCGYDLATGAPLPREKETTFFALHLVRLGYVVAACDAYPFHLVSCPEGCGGRQDFLWWRAAAAELRRRFPRWTGTGKLAADTRLAVEFLTRQSVVDADRIGVMGHSLGGKMAFYAGCLDERVKAVVGSDFGIGWDQTNWSDPWYWGAEKVEELRRQGLEHWQLPAARCPLPFFLIAGEFDNKESWRLLAPARERYAAAGAEENLGFFNHASGHRPTAESLLAAYRFLGRHLEMTQPETTADFLAP